MTPQDPLKARRTRFLRLVRRGTRYCDADEDTAAADHVIDGSVWWYLDTSCQQREAEIEREGMVSRGIVLVPHDDEDTAYMLVLDDESDADRAVEHDKLPASEPYLTLLGERVRRYDALGSWAPSDLRHSYVRPNLALQETPTSTRRTIDCEQIGGLRRVLVTGPAGSGKTSLLRWIALDAAREFDASRPTGPLPIYLEARRLGRSQIDLAGLRHAIGNEGGGEIAHRFEELAHGGALLLIVDGLDEVIDVERSTFLYSLDALEATFPNLRIILSTRPYGISDNLTDFARIEVLPFSDKQVAEWTWLRQPSARRWQEFSHQMAESRALTELTTNPLMLTVAWNLFTQRAVLPRERGGVLNAIVDTLCEDWDAGRGVRRTNAWRNRQGLFTLLCRLSFDLASEDRQVFGVDDVERSLRWIVTTSFDGQISALAERTPLVKPVGRERWAFTHVALQESLAARYAVASASDASIYFRDTLGLRHGQRIWSYACGTALDAGELLRTMLATDVIDDRNRAILLAKALSQGVATDHDLLSDCAARVVTALERVLSDAIVEDGSPDGPERLRLRLPADFEPRATDTAARLVNAILRVGSGTFGQLIDERLSAAEGPALQALALLHAGTEPLSASVHAEGAAELVVSLLEPPAPTAPSARHTRAVLLRQQQPGAATQSSP